MFSKISKFFGSISTLFEKVQKNFYPRTGVSPYPNGEFQPPRYSIRYGIVDL